MKFIIIIKSILCLSLLILSQQNPIQETPFIVSKQDINSVKPSKSVVYSQKFFSDMKDNMQLINGNLTNLVESLEGFYKNENSKTFTSKGINNKTNSIKSRVFNKELYIKGNSTGNLKVNSISNSTNNSLILNLTLSTKLHNAINSLHEVNKTISSKIEGFEKFFFADLKRIKNLSKNKKRNYDNGMLFYNSISLVMLSMLAGGLVGVVFILYFTFKKDESSNI